MKKLITTWKKTKTSVMFTPPNNKTRCLFTAWVKPVNKKLKMYVVPSAFVEFFDLDRDKTENILGEEGWRQMELEDINNFTKALESILITE